MNIGAVLRSPLGLILTLAIAAATVLLWANRDRGDPADWAAVWFGIIIALFVGVGALLSRRSNSVGGAWALMAGNDNRLSLAKSQAWLWTLIISGSYIAAISATGWEQVDQDWVFNFDALEFGVGIPSILIVLMGLSITTGVISSIFSATGDTDFVGEPLPTRVDDVTDTSSIVKQIETSTPPGRFAKAQLIAIFVSHPKDAERTRVLYGDRQLTYIRPDDDQSTAKVAFFSTKSMPNLTGTSLPFVVDMPRGRFVYKGTTLNTDSNGNISAFTLGMQSKRFQFSDLIRDDSNPAQVSLMKFQMLAWTMIAIAIYIGMLLSNLPLTSGDGENGLTLPALDETLVTMTGVSLTGYLAAKGAQSAGTAV